MDPNPNVLAGATDVQAVGAIVQLQASPFEARDARDLDVNTLA
jgi:hypothetical protein